MASASSENGITATTGPKISSRHTGSATDRGSTTVGGNQNPPANASSSGTEPRKATSAADTYEATDSRWAALISGPIWASGDAGSATRNPDTAGRSSSRKRSYTPACTRIRDRAQQSCPALSNTDPGADAAASSRSASAKTMFA